MDEVITLSLPQIAWQAAGATVYLAGMILAIVFWRRCPVPSICVLIGSLVLLLALFGEILFQNYVIIQIRDGQGWTPEDINRTMPLAAITVSAIRAGAFSLVLAAAFIGRKTTPACSHPAE